MDGYRDQDMGDIILGEPFCKASCVEARRFDGLFIIHNDSDNVIYQMARSHPRFKHLSNAQCNKIKPFLKVNLHDKLNGISHPYQKLKSFNKGDLNLGPEYVRDAKIEEWVTRGHISVHELRDIAVYYHFAISTFPVGRQLSFQNIYYIYLSVMSSSPHSTITSSAFDMENAFSTMNIYNYTSASSGSTSFNSSEDSRDDMIPPTSSLFYNNPYLKDVQAFYAKESPIPPPDPITPPVILTPSLVLPPSLLFDP
ncbi:hypothetical protein Tco_1111313 [Tanacetum coccineum]|uniref:Uncharacterized protein n=1 Tax=Tanacetum coccineum TaxID=301880 RepID=A0ABQ5IL91_9ASTR